MAYSMTIVILILKQASNSAKPEAKLVTRGGVEKS